MMPTITERELEMFERFRTVVHSVHNYPAKYGNFPYSLNDNAKLNRVPKPSDGAFFKITINPGQAVKRELGGAGTKTTYPGLLTVQINVPVDSGELLLNLLVQAVDAAFKQKNIAGLWYRSPHPEQKLQADGWVQRTVQCPYRFFT